MRTKTIHPFAPSETEEQIAVIEYCDLRGILCVHIPNEGKRSEISGAILKREGLRKGFPDLFFPIPSRGYHGLFIEMKSRSGKVSAEQDEWLKILSENGYAVRVCYSADAAIETITKYLQEKGDHNAR